MRFLALTVLLLIPFVFLSQAESFICHPLFEVSYKMRGGFDGYVVKFHPPTGKSPLCIPINKRISFVVARYKVTTENGKRFYDWADEQSWGQIIVKKHGVGGDFKFLGEEYSIRPLSKNESWVFNNHEVFEAMKADLRAFEERNKK